MSIRFSFMKNNYSTSPSQQVHARAQVAPASVCLPVSLVTRCIFMVCNAPVCLLENRYMHFGECAKGHGFEEGDWR